MEQIEMAQAAELLAVPGELWFQEFLGLPLIIHLGLGEEDERSCEFIG